MWAEGGYDSCDDEAESEMERYLHALKSVSEVLPGKLYLSGADAAGAPGVVKRYGLRGVISLGGFEEHVHYTVHKDEAVDYLFVFIDDHESEPIEEHFEDCVRFIERAPGAVLVHCAAGISRSATIVMAYLMLHLGMDYMAAMVHLKRCRPCVRPNAGFRRALLRLQ